MSEMIECDKCKKKMYKDSRSDKGSYCAMMIDHSSGISVYHLCRECHRRLLTEFLEECTEEEYDEEFGEA